MEISIKEMEVAKLNLKPGDVLAVTVKSNRLTSESLNFLKDQLNELFNGNQIFLIGMNLDEEVKFSIMDEQPKGCGVQSYCDDCSCGKKERLKAEKDE